MTIISAVIITNRKLKNSQQTFLISDYINYCNCKKKISKIKINYFPVKEVDLMKIWILKVNMNKIIKINPFIIKIIVFFLFNY